MTAKFSVDTPTYAVPEKSLVPVSDYLGHLAPIPPSRMFLINKSLVVYNQNNPDSPTYDASQGDGGASLPGTPRIARERSCSPCCASTAETRRSRLWSSASTAAPCGDACASSDWQRSRSGSRPRKPRAADMKRGTRVHEEDRRPWRLHGRHGGGQRPSRTV